MGELFDSVISLVCGAKIMKLDLSEQSGDGIMVPISLAFYSHYNGNTLGHKL